MRLRACLGAGKSALDLALRGSGVAESALDIALRGLGVAESALDLALRGLGVSQSALDLALRGLGVSRVCAPRGSGLGTKTHSSGDGTLSCSFSHLPRL